MADRRGRAGPSCDFGSKHFSLFCYVAVAVVVVVVAVVAVVVVVVEVVVVVVAAPATSLNEISLKLT